MKGRANYLCLHRFAATARRHRGRFARATASYLDDGRRLGRRRTETGRPRRARGPARGRAVLGEHRRDQPRTASASDCPRVRRLLRDAHAPARRRVRRRDRQSPPAVRRRRRAAGRVRRGDPRVRLRRDRRGPSARGRGHAVLRVLGQQLPGRRARARRRPRAWRQAASADDDGELGRRHDARRRTGPALLRRARAGAGPPRPWPATALRAATTASASPPRTWSPRRRPGARVLDALDALEAAGRARRRDAARGRCAPSARRAAEIRDELRFLLQANDRDYVYYLEMRGRGVFLRASPIDVSSLVRNLLLDRFAAAGADLGDARRRGIVRLRPQPPRASSAATSSSSPSEFDFAPQAHALPAAADAVAEDGRLRAGRRPRGRRHPPADARDGPSCSSRATPCCATVQAAARRRARVPDARPGHARRARRCSRSSGRRRTPCCWRPRASGRAWTWSARR